MSDDRYLGDGVYVEFDGYHIVVKANSHSNPSDTIYLDHYTALSLIRYIEDIWGTKEERER